MAARAIMAERGGRRDVGLRERNGRAGAERGLRRVEEEAAGV